MAQEHKEHIVSPLVYVLVLLALMVLLALTLTAAFVDLDKMIAGEHHRGTAYWNMIVAVLIAIMKAVLIILFFMHVKFSSRLTWAFASAGFFWLGIMMTLSLSDYFTRNYPPGTPKSAPMLPSPEHMRPPPALNTNNGPSASALPPRLTPVPSHPTAAPPSSTRTGT
jgi:cytochrome c oxidase subunit 4